jgi:hypothetical protein
VTSAFRPKLSWVGSSSGADARAGIAVLDVDPRAAGVELDLVDHHHAAADFGCEAVLVVLVLDVRSRDGQDAVDVESVSQRHVPARAEAPFVDVDVARELTVGGLQEDVERELEGHARFPAVQ